MNTGRSVRKLLLLCKRDGVAWKRMMTAEIGRNGTI